MPSKKTLLSAAAVLAVAMPLAATAPAAVADEKAELILATADRIDGSYTVMLKENVGVSIASTTESTIAQAKKNGIKVDKELPGIGAFVAEMNESQLDALRSDDRVLFVEENRMVSLPTFEESAPADQNVQAVGAWGIDRINQPNLPLDNRYTAPGRQGAGVHVYVIDTGINRHPELASIGRGYDAIDKDNTPGDCQGHGSHVAGTVAGRDVGVAPRATVHGVRVLNCEGKGTLGQVIDGMDWVAQNAQKPAVANMSLGGSFNRTENEAIARLVRAGVTTAVASGNETDDACDHSPGSAPEALTVGNTTKRDATYTSSNYGRCVDILAPGTDIRSLANDGRGYRTYTGTSMASPHVAGAAALLLGENSSMTPSQIDRRLKSDAVRNKISNVKGSPNLLLQVGPGKPGDDDDDDDNNPPPGGFFENNERMNIRNYGEVSSRINSTKSGAGSLKLVINMSHSCANHIGLDIVTPDGRSNTIKRSSYAYGYRCWAWNGEKSDSYKMQSRSNGSWVLRASDNYGGASGTLNGWSIELS